MKLTAQIKLQPTPAQADALLRTIQRANAACDAISSDAWESQTFGQFALHRRMYQRVRGEFGLAAQMAVQCLAKVADAYKDGPQRQRRFRPTGGIAYDDRLLSWNPHAPAVSIWTLDGRQAIPFVAGARHVELLRYRKGESDLVYRRGRWYLLITCDLPEPEPLPVTDALGVDLGVTNIATDSDGTIYSGRTILGVRYRQRRLRAKLQRKGTLSARRLRKLAGQEARFAAAVNHTISKQLALRAERTKRAIALEDLTHIRSRVRARRPQRAVLHTWSFFQLRAFIQYKARRVGVPVVVVDATNTSRTCPACGHVDKENRRAQAVFCCVRCAYAGHADTIAAIVIGRRAAVSRPHVSDAAVR